MQFLSLVAFLWYVFCRFMYNKCVYTNVFAYPEYKSFSWVFPVTDQCYVVLNFSSFR